ncbi:nucleotidyltransferase family protein [Vibrio sp. HN007]|uniref:nucleotidyltransferase domain-containing protein n=1 Tax=Vibrio iocasae TaxID=3098914 RepID=UPI0035D50456
MIRLADVLVNPEILNKLSPLEISDIVSQARYQNMLSQLHYICKDNEVWESLPPRLKTHLVASTKGYISQQTQLRAEAVEFGQLLQPLGVSWVYLKGSAYHLKEMDNFKGRVMADIDILVPEKDLPSVEAVLVSNGWVQSHIDDYDDKFYREWSHEIPPLRHLERRTELDLHFNILPKTLKESPNSSVLIQNSIAINESAPNARVLSLQAMAIHSSIHLFYESEFQKGFRDLFDLYLLLSGKSEQFWHCLLDLQSQLGNGDSMFYALRYCKLTFGLNVPGFVTEFYSAYKPNSIKLLLADFAFRRVFTYPYPPHRLPLHHLAESMLYLRGHIKRMPLQLLIPHLVKKTIKSFKKEEEQGLIF